MRASNTVINVIPRPAAGRSGGPKLTCRLDQGRLGPPDRRSGDRRMTVEGVA